MDTVIRFMEFGFNGWFGQLGRLGRRRGRVMIAGVPQFQFAGRVVQDDVMAGEPAEEVFERALPFALRAPAQDDRTAVA